jgi:hypothetical protein
VNVDDPVTVVPDYLTGRIPAGDAATALAVVTQKVLGYERAAPFGEYRNALVLLADDDAQGEKCDPLTWTHITQTTNLDQAHTPQHIDRNYVYLHTFESGPGNTKPGARTELFKRLNAGTDMFNYVGHGSPFKMTDEGVFLDSDAGSLTNGLRQSLLVAASCDVGKFNDPSVQSLGERMVLSTIGGSIAVVSATEQALSGLNGALNNVMYDAMFDRDTLTVAGVQLPSDGQYHVPISAALLVGKADPSLQGKNSEKYQLMGDPATLLNLPRLWADLRLTNDAGVTLSELARGSTVRFVGQVQHHPGGPPVAMDGVASILIEIRRPRASPPTTWYAAPPRFPTCSAPGPCTTATSRSRRDTSPGTSSCRSTPRPGRRAASAPTSAAARPPPRPTAPARGRSRSPRACRPTTTSRARASRCRSWAAPRACGPMRRCRSTCSMTTAS